MSRRAVNIGYWLGPMLLGLVLYWPGLMCWFQNDDFVWLKLLKIAREGQGFRWALFAPLSQGPVRTLSERIFFMSFSGIFGVNPLPYRCWAFLTFALSLIVLGSLCSKLTGSRAAGFWAMILWTVNSAMGNVLSWTAIYYEILCALFLLTGLWLLVRYVETGRQGFYVAQWITFLLGFTVLELNVVYPALATAYALCCARRILVKVLPMFVVSAGYTLWHTSIAPLQTSGPYKLYWDTGILSTLWTYWKWALGPNRLIFLGIYPSSFRSVLALLLMAGMFGFLGWKMYRREWLTAFCAAWFVIALAPLLLLRDHMDGSYLTVPLIGLAMWGGWGVVCGWRAGRLGKIAAVSLLAIYLCVSIPVARVVAVSYYDRTQRIRNFVMSVVDHTRGQKDKLVLLKGVDPELFWQAVVARPFPLFGLSNVYVLAEEGPKIAPEQRLKDYQGLFADQAMARDALRKSDAIVLDVSGGNARDVTSGFDITNK
jgi:hypothetical protein